MISSALQCKVLCWMHQKACLSQESRAFFSAKTRQSSRQPSSLLFGRKTQKSKETQQSIQHQYYTLSHPSILLLLLCMPLKKPSLFISPSQANRKGGNYRKEDGIFIFAIKNGEPFYARDCVVCLKRRNSIKGMVLPSSFHVFCWIRFVVFQVEALDFLWFVI